MRDEFGQCSSNTYPFILNELGRKDQTMLFVSSGEAGWKVASVFPPVLS